jgi:hypothetical protein
MYKLLMSVLVCFVMVGCSGTRGNTLEVTNKVSYVSVPADKLVTVNVPSPPAKEVYIKLSPIEKEKSLADYATKLMVALSQANGIIEDIKEWNSQLMKKNEN